MIRPFQQTITVCSTREQWQAYVEEESVRCLSASDLLSHIGVHAADVVSTSIDAEGADESILRGFLAVPGWEPHFFQVEGEPASNLELLHRGYDLYDVWGQDIVALRGH
eukprot:gnl/TRDRNA2_/TRDRNA2_148333_c0_seq1.p1 gnl/TRDRNA2_/TRDRNA2_148333_c0~~gnl/TRDRNA2_/TRDRNA2_148333_c0_seq1.p1  ORF type:complete len:109 (+),score=15.00 gnl/TRDRNA2_/TRDRNA2_148333_c0_seq1:40-366(+)